jgi:hypothetical protein
MAATFRALAFALIVAVVLLVFSFPHDVSPAMPG